MIAKSENQYKEMIEEAGCLCFENTENIIASIIKCAKQKSFVKISAPSGTGKTTAINIIAAKLPATGTVTAYDGMSAKEFLEDLTLAVKIKNIAKSAKEMMRNLKEHLRTNRRLIVVDEANFIREKSLEQLRHIHDMCGIGIVLAGTEALDMTIARSHPQVTTRIRNSLEVKPFGADEVKMMCAKYGIFEAKAEEIHKAKRNLRDVEYFLQDYIEVYGTDESSFKEGLKRL